MMDQNTDDVRGRVSTYTRKLKKRLNKDSEETRTTQNIDMVRERVEPYVSQAHETAAEKLGTFTVLLKNQAEGLGQQLETQAEGLREQLEVTAQDLRTALETKIDELTLLLSPYATKIREQVQTVVDKVKETAA